MTEQEKAGRKTRSDKGKTREKVYMVTVAGDGEDPRRLTEISQGNTAQEAWDNAAGVVVAGQEAACWQRVGTPKTAQLTFATKLG